jgi:hypothetical protein
MTLDTFATIRVSNERLTEMIRQAAAGFHADLYMRVLGDEHRVEFLASSNGRQVVSYCTFSDLDYIEGEGEAILPTGIDNDNRGILDYLGVVEGSGKIEMTLKGEEQEGAEHPRLASHWSAEGKLVGTVRLPASRDDLKKVPWAFPERFWGDDQRYLSKAAFDDDWNVTADDALEYAPSTVIETTAQSIREGVIQPANFMDSINYYPLIVEGEEFRLNLQANDGDDSLAGEVHVESVEGPDVSRQFDEGFEELFGEISGPVRLATSPAEGEGPNPPLVVVQNNRSGETQRHIVGPFAED